LEVPDDNASANAVFHANATSIEFCQRSFNHGSAYDFSPWWFNHFASEQSRKFESDGHEASIKWSNGRSFRLSEQRRREWNKSRRWKPKQQSDRWTSDGDRSARTDHNHRHAVSFDLQEADTYSYTLHHGHCYQLSGNVSESIVWSLRMLLWDFNECI
jgi:hypothetical protein